MHDYLFILFEVLLSGFKLIQQERREPHLSVIGTWEVFKVLPVIDYKGDTITKKRIKSCLNQILIFKKDSVISDIECLNGRYSGVRYFYKTELTKNHFGTDIMNYLNYTKKNVTVIRITYLNNYTHTRDTLTNYASMELFSKDTLHIFHDVEELFLKRIHSR